MVNKITWQKAGRVAVPGRYMFTFGWLIITADDLRVWEQFPDAAFTLVRLPQQSGGSDSAADISQDGASGEEHDLMVEEFHLGAFEIPLSDRVAVPQGSQGEA